MKKRTYRIVPIGEVKLNGLVTKATGKRVVFAIDVAKVDMVAAVVAEGEGVLMTVGWKAPAESAAVLALLDELRAGARVLEVAMEPSGTYSDAIRHQLLERGHPVYRVSGKRTHDAAELYDGVPSLHDAKCAAIVARLHLDGLSSPWTAPSEHRRQLQAALAIMELHQDHYLRMVGKLESWTARHWPEVSGILDLTHASLLALFARIGGPERVAKDPGAALKLLHGMSRGLLAPEKAKAVVDSAATTCGVPMLEEENGAFRELSEEALRAGRLMKGAKRRVEELGVEGPAKPLASVMGKATAAVLVHDVGDPAAFSSSRAYLKAYGLNLKEKSSGMQKGRLAITKRGPARARKYLWLAACRWIQKDALTRAWYQRKVERDGGRKARAVVAVMRKLGKALFHVARGAPFDSRKLFDESRLPAAA